MKTPLTVLHVFACIFLMLVVLIQPGKSGGLGAFGGGAQQVFGGRGAGNFLTRTTWITGATFFFTSISLAYLSTSVDASLEKKAKAAASAHAPAPTPPEAASSPTPPEPASAPPPASPPPAGS
ncbi:MAG: preprotein translocase subunit SecG [Polyangiaceae bacterium]|nr:preprotein translocase subunit SecG [Polyangiaceae bacterium]